MLLKACSLVGEQKIDILVNNAGILSRNNFGEAEIDDFEKVIKTNAESVYFLSQAVYQYMKKNEIKGNILNVTSSSAKRPAISAYTMSKWSVKALTLGLAKKLIKDGIVVNAVAPGVTETPMMIADRELGENIMYDKAPIGRYILPEEVANIATVLVSDMGRCIVGDTIYVTGGAGVITYDDMTY